MYRKYNKWNELSALTSRDQYDSMEHKTYRTMTVKLQSGTANKAQSHTIPHKLTLRVLVHSRQYTQVMVRELTGLLFALLNEYIS